MRAPPMAKLRRLPVEFVMTDVAGSQAGTVLGGDTAMARNSASHALGTPATATIGQPSRFSLRGHSDDSADEILKQEHNNRQQTEQNTTIALQNQDRAGKPKPLGEQANFAKQAARAEGGLKAAKTTLKATSKENLAATTQRQSLEEQEMRIRANIELVERAGLTQLTQAFEKPEVGKAQPILQHTMPNMSYW